MKIIYFGTPEFVIPVVEAINKNFELVGVITGPDQILGRKKLLTPSPIKDWIIKHSPKAKIFAPEILSIDLAEDLKKLKPDLIIVAAYGKIIPGEVLESAKYGSVNIHPSLLPKYRGPTPVQAAILAGDEVSGVTIIKMDEKMDHGPIIHQEEFKLSLQDNQQTLHNKLFQLGIDRLIELMEDYINGKLKPVDQDHSKATFTKLIKKEDGYFDISNPPTPKVLDRKIRAYYPWPNVWTKWNGKIVKFLPEKMVQIEGKNPISLKNFLNGYPDFPLKDF